MVGEQKTELQKGTQGTDQECEADKKSSGGGSARILRSGHQNPELRKIQKTQTFWRTQNCHKITPRAAMIKQPELRSRSKEDYSLLAKREFKANSWYQTDIAFHIRTLSVYFPGCVLLLKRSPIVLHFELRIECESSALLQSNAFCSVRSVRFGWSFTLTSNNIPEKKSRTILIFLFQHRHFGLHRSFMCTHIPWGIVELINAQR